MTRSLPSVVYQHDLAMDVDVAATTLRVQACNPDQRKVLIPAKRSYAIEQRLTLRVLPRKADMLFRIGGNEHDNLHAAPEGMLPARPPLPESG